MARRHSVAARALALLNELRTRTDERGTASSNPSPSCGGVCKNARTSDKECGGEPAAEVVWAARRPGFPPPGMVRRGDPTRTGRCLPPAGPIRMAQGVPKNFRNRVGSLAAGNSPTNAVTTTDISLTVRVYDHAGLGSPPPKHLGVQSSVGMPSPALLLSCNSPSRSHDGFARGQITASETETAGPEAGSRRARVRCL